MSAPTVQKQWRVADRLDSDLLTHLLKQRGLDQADVQKDYFNPSLDQLPAPTVFPQIQAAVDRISQALAQQQPIVVWGDFDADGVTSTAILWQTLHSLNAKVMPYIPNREDEGHGFSEVGLRQIADQGTQLVITCDHGITAFEHIELLNDLGMEVIITDHHEPRQETGDGRRDATKAKNTASSLQSPVFSFPKAVAVIHPLQAPQVGQLAGCGVAYFLAYAVWLEVKKQTDNLASRQKFADTYLELATIGTIADLMPLTGINRIIASVGLTLLPRTKRPGLQQLYALAKIQDKKDFSVYDVGFAIAPRLNAPGRLADALDSLRLLCTTDQSRALTLAKQLNFLNTQRQDLLAEVADQARHKAEQSAHDGVFVLADPDWPAGVCGLAAGKLVETFYRPAVVMEQQGEQCRGSARSIKGFDITAALNQISHLLIFFGGHAMAAGFVAKTELIPQIQDELSKLLFAQLSPDQLQPTLDIDAQVSLSQMDQSLYQQLQKFEPCGMANRQPVFLASGLTVASFQAMGGEGKHLRLTLDDPQTTELENTSADLSQAIEGMTDHDVANIFSTKAVSPVSSLRSPSPAGGSRLPSPAMSAVAFNHGHLADTLDVQTKVDIVFTLDENVWQNRRNLQLMIKDIKISSSNKVKSTPDKP